MDRAEGALRVAELALAEARRALRAVADMGVIEGPKGDRGEQGERGIDGAPGKLPMVGAWRDRVYHEADVVTSGGSVYQARLDTGKQPPHADWICIASAGRSLNPRSTWSATETYAALDIVALDGGSFVARVDNPGACPGADWQQIVTRGKPGLKGEKGDAGRGEKGDPGPAVVSIDVDRSGMLTWSNADGTTGENDIAPVLSQLL